MIRFSWLKYEMRKSKSKIILRSLYSIEKSLNLYLCSFIKNSIHFLRKLKLIYKFLAIVFFFIGLYLIIYPFIPGLLHYLFHKEYTFPYKTIVGEVAGVKMDSNESIPTEDRIVIPKINVNMPIVEGSDEDALDLGVWHRPGTGIPGRGNMVLTGHRFGYEFLPENIRNSTSFYNLDKLEGGDFVVIYWKGEEYDYIIEGSDIVDRLDTSIEGETPDERLTLYTCHPIGRNDKRLVYYARPYK